jgi:2-oxoglutarate dehydrogenase E2 component (dihydrolipoamide succinyltransferase)
MMTKEIRVPALGESVSEATIAKWFHKEGDIVKADEPVVELETDKVTVEVPAPASGRISAIAEKAGATVNVGALLGTIEEGTAASKPAAEPSEIGAGRKPQAPRIPAAQSPAVRKIVAENRVDVSNVQGSGKDGRLTKGDVLAEISKPRSPAAAPISEAEPMPAIPVPVRAPSPAADAAREERVRMSRLRQTIARRLKDAQNVAAMLTTFNEVDMSQVMSLRNAHKDSFEKKHGVKLGFMSFFVRAVIQALKDIPAVNAEIDGEDIVYKNYYNIGVAVGTDKGLVVPVIRDADKMSFAEIEKKIANFGKLAREGQLQIADMQGGTFTISNGGVYGSLMSTPILNAPQSGILGMHKIQDRPVVANGQIAIRPMMYLALSYDHRIVDGKEAVTFLVRIKDIIEDPQRALLDL